MTKPKRKKWVTVATSPGEIKTGWQTIIWDKPVIVKPEEVYRTRWKNNMWLYQKLVEPES